MTEHSIPTPQRAPWNRRRLIGQKRPLKPKDVWTIRVQLQMEGRRRDLAMFNLAIDSKLRGCDLVRLRLRASTSLKNSLLSGKIQGISSNLGPDHDPVAAKTTPILAPYRQISLRRDNREIFAANREFYRMIRQFWPRSGNLKIPPPDEGCCANEARR